MGSAYTATEDTNLLPGQTIVLVTTVLSSSSKPFARPLSPSAMTYGIWKARLQQVQWSALMNRDESTGWRLLTVGGVKLLAASTAAASRQVAFPFCLLCVCVCMCVFLSSSFLRSPPPPLSVCQTENPSGRWLLRGEAGWVCHLVPGCGSGAEDACAGLLRCFGPTHRLSQGQTDDAPELQDQPARPTDGWAETGEVSLLCSSRLTD